MSIDALNGTYTPKQGEDWLTYWSPVQIQKVGVVDITAAGACTWDANEGYTFSDTGNEVVAVVDGRGCNSQTPVTLEVTGTDGADGAQVLSVEIIDFAPRAFARIVGGAGTVWKTITGVTCTNGAKGDLIRLMVLPTDDDFKYPDWTDRAIALMRNWNIDPGEESYGVWEQYENRFNKRMRSEDNFTAMANYLRYRDGFPRIRNRDICLRLDCHDDGESSVSEQVYMNIRLNAPINMAEGSPGEVSVTGRYTEIVVFS